MSSKLYSQPLDTFLVARNLYQPCIQASQHPEDRNNGEQNNLMSRSLISLTVDTPNILFTSTPPLFKWWLIIIKPPAKTVLFLFLIPDGASSAACSKDIVNIQQTTTVMELKFTQDGAMTGAKSQPSELWTCFNSPYSWPWRFALLLLRCCCCSQLYHWASIQFPLAMKQFLNSKTFVSQINIVASYDPISN